MAEGGRELGHVPCDINVLLIPAHERLEGKAVAKIV